MYTNSHLKSYSRNLNCRSFRERNNVVGYNLVFERSNSYITSFESNSDLIKSNTDRLNAIITGESVLNCSIVIILFGTVQKLENYENML